MIEMSVPPENLAIYPQKYTVRIDNKYKPSYSVVGFLPSNESEKRVLNMVLAFTIANSTQFIDIAYDFSQIDQQGFDATIQRAVSGQLTMGKKYLDTTKYITYNYNVDTKILNIVIKNPFFKCVSIDFFNVFYNIFIHDTDCSCNCYSQGAGACTGGLGGCCCQQPCCGKDCPSTDCDCSNSIYCGISCTGQGGWFGACC
jgi:hypothetical protein